jgi:hypothetical protein
MTPTDKLKKSTNEVEVDNSNIMTHGTFIMVINIRNMIHSILLNNSFKINFKMKKKKMRKRKS